MHGGCMVVFQLYPTRDSSGSTMMQQAVALLTSQRELLADENELANSLTHGAGLILSLVGAGYLLQHAAAGGPSWCLLACAIYSSSLIAVYAASTLSHAVSEPRLKRLFRIWDQGFIYLLIAGTYTPYGMVYLRTGAWSLLLITMWIIALAGFFSKVVWAHRIDGVSIVTCVAMGWLPGLAIWPLLHVMPTMGFVWLLLGGIAYTVGTLFLKWDHKAPFFHATWHLLVITGSACHYISILRYIVMQPGA